MYDALLCMVPDKIINTMFHYFIPSQRVCLGSREMYLHLLKSEERKFSLY